MIEQQTNPEILVIGGGIIGLAIARELHKKGARAITALDKGSCGREASWAAAGMLGPQSEADDNGPFFDLCRPSRDLYPQLAAELLDETDIDIELDRSGTLHVAFDDVDSATLARRYQWQKADGLQVERLSADDLRRVEPDLSPAAIEALLFPDDWQVENRVLLRALRRYAELNGIHVHECHSVDGVIVEKGKVMGVETAAGRLDAGQVVLATGAWTSLIKLGSMRMPFKVEPVRGQIIAFRPNNTSLRHVVSSHDGYLVPRKDGRILAGSTTENVGFDVSTTGAAIEALRRMAVRLVPELDEVSIADSWAGLRPLAADGFPVLGEIDGLAGLFVATAHYRNGILLAPVTAKLAAETLIDGFKSPSLDAFGPDRFQALSVGTSS